MRPLVLGTAGHIDHGKTCLVKALTGKDTDRLPEEQERGISIDLGYAPLELAGGRQLSLVDVPGHERFVRNMVAGASGVDLFLFVIDAGEGARAQTYEHLAILRLLGVTRGVVAVTKADAVDSKALEVALAEARQLVPDAETVAVSAKTGTGLEELRAAISRVADQTPERGRGDTTRLWVDRVFTLRGIGTVATGTLWSGSIAEGDVLRIEPSGNDARIRSVQVHDRPVEQAEAGQRVAVNIAGVERDRLQRGYALVEPGRFPLTYRLDVALDELEPVPSALTLHLGTKDVAVRIVRSGRFAQLRLQEALVAARGDRFVLRAATTLGGGLVLDPSPPRRLDPKRLEILGRGDPREIVRATVLEPVTRQELQARGLLQADELTLGLEQLGRAGDFYFAPKWLDELRERVGKRLAERARTTPLDPGISIAELLPAKRWAPAILTMLGVERRGAKAYLPGAAASLGDRAEAAKRVESELARGAAVKVEDRALAAYLEGAGRLKRVGDGLAVSAELYERGREALAGLSPITIAAFRDALGVSRRTAQYLLERYDADGLTRRVGDERVLRRAALRG